MTFHIPTITARMVFGAVAAAILLPDLYVMVIIFLLAVAAVLLDGVLDGTGDRSHQN